MRVVLAAIMLTAGALPALAQPVGPPQPLPAGAITRDQFIQRAAAAAARRFDEIDVDHTGVITRAQMRAWRQAHLNQQGGAPSVEP